MQEIGFSDESTLLDIGSGFGKAVFDFALTTSMLCLGYEIVDVRTNYSIRRLDKFKTSFKDNATILECLNRVQFQHLNIINVPELETSCGRPITHIYSFNVMFSEKDNQIIVDLINKSPQVEVLAWSLSKSKTFD